MAKTKKAKKKSETKGKRISLATRTREAATTKAGLHREIVNHDGLDQGDSYKRGQTNHGLRLDEHPDAKVLDINDAVQALGISQYDVNKKRRQEVVAYIAGQLGKLKKGDVVAWAGRNGDTKSGNVNKCAKYFFSNAKSSVSGQKCEATNYFAITSAETKVEA